MPDKREIRLGQIKKALSENDCCQLGILSPRNVFSTPNGPSYGPEVLTILSADDRWGRRIWLGHVFRIPGSSEFTTGVFHCSRLLNGSSSSILFKRLHHWTVIDPNIGAAVTSTEGDCYASSTTFEEGLGALSYMISSFNLEQRSGITDHHTKAQTNYDNRILKSYEEWGDKIDFWDAFPIPAASAATPKIRSEQEVQTGHKAQNVTQFPATRRKSITVD